MAGTFYDVLKVLNKYIGQKDAHKRVVDYLVSQKIKADMDDAWCTEFIMAVLKEAGCSSFCSSPRSYNNYCNISKRLNICDQ